MNYLFNFFEETPEQGNGWVTWLVMGAMILLLILMTVIPQRKQKKKTEEMLSKLNVGTQLITIGGIVGVVVQLDEQYVWIETGTNEQKQVLQFLRQAIHSTVSVPGSPEAVAQQEANETNEIQ